MLAAQEVSTPEYEGTFDGSRVGREQDPVRFCVDGGFRPDAWQVDFLRSHAPYRMLNCSRQVGKSTVVAWGALHRVAYNPGSLVLLVSRGERQSMELMLKVRAAMHNAPDVPKLVRDGALGLEFGNGSRLLALPGKGETVRGFSSVDLIIVDEAALVPNDLYVAVRPMLAVSGGHMWTLSSPFGSRGWWYEQWKRVVATVRHHRRPVWEYYEIPATACPRISEEFLEEELLNLGEWWYNQEYFCRFLDAQGAAFGTVDVEAAFNEKVLPWSLGQ